MSVRVLKRGGGGLRIDARREGLRWEDSACERWVEILEGGWQCHSYVMGYVMRAFLMVVAFLHW